MHCLWFQSSHCSSCTLLNLTYEESLSRKQSDLLEILPEVKTKLLPIVGLKQVEASRSKAKLAVYRAEGKITFGFYDEKGIPKQLAHCPLHKTQLNNLLPELAGLLEAFAIEPYDIKTKKGEIKYLILSESESHGEILCRFTIRSKESLDRLRKLALELQLKFPSVKVVTANLQPLHQAVMEGDEKIVLSVEQMIQHRFDKVHLTLGPRSFFQVTPEMALALYSSVGNLVKKFQMRSFLDLYCGVGAFSYFAALNAKKVLGVELSKEAIRCAESSIAFNQVAGDISFQSLDVEKFLQKKGLDFESVMVNPPRRGLNDTIITSLLSGEFKYLFYSSCNARTLARDHVRIAEAYNIVSVQIFDMFPFTEHFETLILYEKKF